MSTIAIRDPTPTAAPGASRDDDALLEDIRRGDPSAMGELFVRHRDHVRRYVASALRAASADEVVSESFARTFRALRNGNGPRDHPRRYLLATARSVVIGQSIQDQRRGAADLLFAISRQRSSSGGSELAAIAVHAALRTLPPRQQAVLWMAEVEDRPASEIGEVLGISSDAVYALASRSRRNMRRAYLEALEREVTGTDLVRST